MLYCARDRERDRGDRDTRSNGINNLARYHRTVTKVTGDRMGRIPSSDRTLTSLATSKHKTGLKTLLSRLDSIV